MSGALDVINDEDKALMAQMQADEAAAGPMPDPAPSPEAERPAPEQTAPEATAPAKPEAPEVPAGAIQKERERRRAAEKRAAELEQQAARFDERWKMLEAAAKAAAPPPPPPAPAPDPAADPMGYVQHQIGDVRQNIGTLADQVRQAQEFQRQQQMIQAQQQQMADLQAWGLEQEQRFRAEQPDYHDAANHLRDVRVRELQAMGISNPVQIKQIVAQDVAQIAVHARQSGADFARMVYDLAKVRGYAPAAASPAAAVPVVEPQPAGQQTPEQRVATVQRGQQMAAGIGSGGQAPRGEVTPDRLATMSEAEFNALYAKVSNNPAEMRRLFGE